MTELSRSRLRFSLNQIVSVTLPERRFGAIFAGHISCR